MAINTNSITPTTADTATAVANTAVTITYAAAERRRVVWGVNGSYSGSPTGGKVQIKRGANVVWEAAITGTSFNFSFTKPIGGLPNEALSVVLAAGGSGVIGIVNVQQELVK